MGTEGYRVPARKKILGFDWYRVPARKKILGAVGYRVPAGKDLLGTDGYRVPEKFSLMPTPALVSLIFKSGNFLFFFILPMKILSLFLIVSRPYCQSWRLEASPNFRGLKIWFFFKFEKIYFCLFSKTT